MRTSEALYEEILRNPLDRTLCWAFRDSLDEEDDPYADAMRLEWDHAFPPGEPPRLWVRRNGSQALISLGVGVPGWELRVRDGLVREVVTDCHHFVEPVGLRKVFTTYPVTRVVLRDRFCFLGILNKAAWVRGGPVWVSGWVNSLPGNLFDLLDGGEPAVLSPETCLCGIRRYETVPEAAEDLSRACVRLGRWVAELPELPRGES